MQRAPCSFAARPGSENGSSVAARIDSLYRHTEGGQHMTERDREDDDELSTERGVHLAEDFRIGSVPGHTGTVDLSGGPGGSTGWGAWPKGMGTSDNEADEASFDPTGEGIDTPARHPRIGAEHGQLADSGVTMGPVGHSDE